MTVLILALEYLIMLIPILVGVYYLKKKSFKHTQFIIFIYTVANFLIELISLFFYIKKVDTSIIYTINDVLFLLLSIIILKKQKDLEKIPYKLLFYVTLFTIILNQRNADIPSITFLISNIFSGISGGLLIQNELIKYDENLWNKYTFWIGSYLILASFPFINIIVFLKDVNFSKYDVLIEFSKFIIDILSFSF